MEDVRFAFNVSFQNGSGTGYVSIHPEMCPAPKGVSPSGRYWVYCMHPVHGTGHFIIEQDKDCNWTSYIHPFYIDKEFICWVGDNIEFKTR